jgi:hypothetical protein
MEGEVELPRDLPTVTSTSRADVVATITSVDGFVVVTSQYDHGTNGELKNAASSPEPSVLTAAWARLVRPDPGTPRGFGRRSPAS